MRALQYQVFFFPFSSCERVLLLALQCNRCKSQDELARERLAVKTTTHRFLWGRHPNRPKPIVFFSSPVAPFFGSFKEPLRFSGLVDRDQPKQCDWNIYDLQSAERTDDEKKPADQRHGSITLQRGQTTTVISCDFLFFILSSFFILHDTRK